MKVSVYETPDNNKLGLMDFTIVCEILDALAAGKLVRDCEIDKTGKNHVLVCENGAMYSDMYKSILRDAGQVLVDLVVSVNEFTSENMYDVTGIRFKALKAI